MIEKRLNKLSLLYSPSNKEVYTPLELVNEILDHLPKEVWNNKDYKWFNPAVKNGVWLGAITIRLKKNYLEKGIFKNEKEALDYILKNQIYGYTVSKGALRTANELLYGDFKYNGNIKYKNALEEQIDMKFDVIVGNPPFQSSSRNKKFNLGATRNLYQKFIEKSCELVKNDTSIISLITPPGFLKSTQWGVSNKYFKMLKLRGIKFLKLEGVKKYFKVLSPFCYFVSTASRTIEIESKETIIKDIEDIFFVPSSLDKTTYSIFEKVASVKNSININFKRLSFKPKTNYVGIKAMNNRLRGVKATVNLKNLSLGNDLLYPTKNAEIISEILNSKIFTYLIRRTQYDALIYFKFFNGFKIPKDLNKHWSDKDLYKFYDLTKEEINSIETFGEYYLR